MPITTIAPRGTMATMGTSDDGEKTNTEGNHGYENPNLGKNGQS